MKKRARTLHPMPNARRHLLRVTIGIALMAAGIGGAQWWWSMDRVNAVRPSARTEPPEINLQGYERAVVDAIQEARAAVRRSPDSVASWGRLGMILLAFDFPEAACDCLSEAEKLDRSDARWPYYHAVAIGRWDFEASIPKLERAVELNAGATPALGLRLAETLENQGRSVEATRHYHRLLAQHAEFAPAQMGLARLAAQRGECKAALELLAALADSPLTRKAAHLLRAECLQRLGDEQAAKQSMRIASELPNDRLNPDPLMSRIADLRVGGQAKIDDANRLLDEGRTVEAITLLDQTTREYPDLGWAWLMLGKAHLRRNNPVAAEKALRAGAERAPHLAGMQLMLATALLAQKDHRAAAVCFRRAIELKPDATAHFLLGHCLRLADDKTGAIAAFRTALRYKPNYPEAALDLATLLQQLGRMEESIEPLRHVLSIHPRHAKAETLLKRAQGDAPLSNSTDRGEPAEK